jgi:m7GpppX diphosphatase
VVFPSPPSVFQWVYNFLEHKAERDRVVFEDPDPNTGFLLAPDLKWDGQTRANLYLQAVIHRRDIKSIRDLTDEHLPLLRNIRHAGLNAIASRYDVRRDQIKAYFHYQPQFFHLHVHFISLAFDAPASGTTQAILLNDVINNLEIAGDFYQRAELTFTRKADDELLRRFRAAGRAEP